MKTLLTILLLVPLLSFGQAYEYNKVVTIERGSDFFGYDHTVTKEVAGKIRMRYDNMSIDGRKFRLKAKASMPGCYKSKGCSVNLVYNGKQLSMIKLNYYQRTTYYYINQPEQPAGTVASK